MRDYSFCSECGELIDEIDRKYHDCKDRLIAIEKMIDNYFDELIEEEGRDTK